MKDYENKEYYCADEDLIHMISLIARDNLLCYQVDLEKFEHLAEMKYIITAFANKIDIINMNNIPINRTIELMKNKNDLQKKVVNFIKNADLYRDDFEYVDMGEVNPRVKELKNRMKRYWELKKKLWIKFV